jgi:transposase
LLPQIADVLIADTAFDADDRVIRPLAAAGKSAVIPPRRNRLTTRAFDQELYKARNLIKNFFAKLKPNFRSFEEFGRWEPQKC